MEIFIVVYLCLCFFFVIRVPMLVRIRILLGNTKDLSKQLSDFCLGIESCVSVSSSRDEENTSLYSK